MVRELETPHGPARVHVEAAGRARALVLGHGAGGGVTAPDLVRAAAVAVEQGWTVVRVEQPYRVAGRRATPRPPVLDAGWAAVLAGLRANELAAATTVVCGGRSSGARVACRTARAVGAAGVLCLAFPLVAPSGSRQAELDGAGVPVLVIQGERDRFGIPTPDAERGREVVLVRGDHGLKADGPRVGAAVGAWLAARARPGSPPRRRPDEPRA